MLFSYHVMEFKLFSMYFESKGAEKNMLNIKM